MYLILGSQVKDVIGAAANIAERLLLSFEWRDSSYWGGDYALARDAAPFAKSLKLHVNVDVVDGTPIFDEHRAFHLLLHVEACAEEETLVKELAPLGFEVISRKFH